MTSFVVYSSALPVGRTECRALFPTYTYATNCLRDVCRQFTEEVAPNDQSFFVETEELCANFMYRVKYDDKMECGMYFLVRGSEIDAFRKTWDVGYIRTARHIQHVAHLGIFEVGCTAPKPVLVPVKAVAQLPETKSHDDVLSELERVIAEFESRRGNRLAGDAAFRERKEDEVAVPERYTQSEFVRDLIQSKQLLAAVPNTRFCKLEVGRVL